MAATSKAKRSLLFNVDGAEKVAATASLAEQSGWAQILGCLHE
jgi:hypothetical protein